MENTTNRNAGRVTDFNHFRFYLPEIKEPTPEQLAEYEAAMAQDFDPDVYELVKSFFAIDAQKAAQNEPGHNHNTIEPAFTALLAYYAGKRAGIREERGK